VIVGQEGAVIFQEMQQVRHHLQVRRHVRVVAEQMDVVEANLDDVLDAIAEMASIVRVAGDGGRSAGRGGGWRGCAISALLCLPPRARGTQVIMPATLGLPPRPPATRRRNSSQHCADRATADGGATDRAPTALPPFAALPGFFVLRWAPRYPE